MQLTVGLIRRAVSGEREAQDELLRIYEPFHDSLLAFAERTKISLFLKELASREGLVAEFDEELWYATVNHVAVYEDKRMVFTFRDHTQVEVPANRWKAA